MTLWIVMLLAGLITYATRLSFIQVFAHQDINPLILRALRFVPPAVLTAIIFPEVLMHDGGMNANLGNYRLIASLFAILVAWRTKNTLLTILAGMTVLWLLQSFAGL